MKDHILASPAFAGDRPPLWAAFDAEWYRTRYGLPLREEAKESGEAGELDLSDEGLEQHWKRKGARAGLSPNRFFDEEWYLRQNPDVREGISLGIFDSGFLHYCESGFRSRSPHWLFSEENYFSCNPDLSPHVLASQGFCNGYDHYLAIGDQEHRKSHVFFDPEVFRAASMAERQHYDFAIGDFAQFIRFSVAGRRRSSWYFDPQWYLERYPDVVDALESGRFQSPLHHYLTNGNPTAYDPNPWFSEAFYAAQYPDVGNIVANGGFRNGYEHFIRFGIAEKRQPQAGVDLAAFLSQSGTQRLLRRPDITDIFTLWVQSQGNPVNEVVADIPADPCQLLDLQRAQTLIPSLIRGPLDFRPVTMPDVTVILPVSNQFLETLATLAALHANSERNLQIILVDAGSTDETAQIERFVRGIHIVRPPYRTTHAEQVALGLELARAEVILLLSAGVQPFPGSLNIALEAFANPQVYAVGGQSLGLDGRVREAGSIVWRNAAFTPFGQGLRANEPEIAFRRWVDAFTGGLLFCRRLPFHDHNRLNPGCIGPEAEMLAICLSLRQAGGKILYDPDVLDRSASEPEIAPELRARNEAWLKRRFAGLLSRQPFPGTSLMRARSASGAPAILFLCERLPHVVLGTPFLRHRDMMIGLSRLGYQVTVFPLDGSLHDCVSTALDFPADIELMDDCDLSELADFLRERAGCFDYVWIGGMKTLQRAAPMLQQHPLALPRLGMVADIHASHARETHNRRLVGAVNDRELLFDDLELDIDQVWMTQAVVAGTEAEKADLEVLGLTNVRVLGAPPVPTTLSPGFGERSGILLVLPVFASGDAVHDGLHWFIHEVLSKLDRGLPPDATVLLAGHKAAGVDLSAFARYRRLEAFPEDADLAALYRSRRILVEPTRVLPAIPREVLDAAAAGLPAVLSETVCKTLGWENGKDCLSGGFCDPEQFAQAVIGLYTDMDLWNTISRGAQARMEEEASRSNFHDGLREILSIAAGTTPLAASTVTPRPHRLSETAPGFAPAPIRLQPRRLTTEGD
ncbi:glycosyltransferase [Gluconobacter oxydans]|uniref:Glycosyl transferase family protein n=1 Tax=Gluconobacter oxydans NBRC 3293 TaxID=1315969 RepID=A0A829X5A5_GLUOY|nr:glycosyltransferase [Gluconobacter oxydans]GEM18017.1 glycosyl transferase family protein [Gluconobacter oxydans NBRC 3293]